MTAPTAYPLSWPPGKPRAKLRVRAAFGKVVTRTRGSGDQTWTSRDKDRVTIADALHRLQRELDLLGASRIVCSTNVEVRLDGFPRSDRRAPDDPGVAVYFRVEGDPVVLAVDRYDTVADNIVAIAKHIEASRAIERYGVGTLKEIFRGYAALPPAMSIDDWRAVLGEPRNLDQAEAVYRERMKAAHPDVGGSQAEAARLNAAIARAREVFA